MGGSILKPISCIIRWLRSKLKYIKMGILETLVRVSRIMPNESGGACLIEVYLLLCLTSLTKHALLSMAVYLQLLSLRSLLDIGTLDSSLWEGLYDFFLK